MKLATFNSFGKISISKKYANALFTLLLSTISLINQLTALKFFITNKSVRLLISQEGLTIAYFS